MRAGRLARWVAGVLLAFALAARPAAADAPATEVRVLSGPEAVSTITVRAAPDTPIEDRTPGAKPAAGAQGPASVGETFTGELTLFLRGFAIPRPAAVDVGDAVVSTVRLFPEEQGTTVVIFVRQPVTYTVSRPSALGEIRIELRSRTKPVQIVRREPRSRPRVVRPKAPGRQVAVDAEQLQYDKQTNTLIARGSVTLTRGNTTLTADEVRYDRTNGLVDATGHVVITDPEATIEGDAAHLNLDDESGWIEPAAGELRPSGYSLLASRVVKKGGPLYSVANGVFSTCRCGGLEKPSWSVAGRQTEIELQGQGKTRDATFCVKDIPVLYFPYFLFPAKTERETGFLFPRISYSNRRGFQYEQPFFWAIDKSSDATVAVDLETAARVGVIGEYRYVLSRQARGRFTLAYYNEQIRGSTQGTVGPGGQPVDVPENRFGMFGHHVQPFVGGSKLYLDLFAISDEVFLREINSFAFSSRSDLQLRSTRFTTNRAGVVKTWENGLLVVENTYYQDLIDPQSLALERLPRIEGEHALPLLGDRLFARLTGQATDFQRAQGYDGLRADLAPGLFLPFNLGRAVSGSLAGNVRETAYHLTDEEQVAFVVPNQSALAQGARAHFRTAPELPRLATDRNRELAEVTGQVGTELSRVFTFRHLGLEKVRHTIEPEVRYLYVPDTSRQIFNVTLPDCDTLPKRKARPGDNCNATLFSEGYLFDERDAINRRNFVSYGITTRLLGRGATPADTAPAPPEAKSAKPAGEGGAVPLDVLPQGLPAGTVPAPGGAGGPAAAPRELLRASILHGYDISRPLVGGSHQSDVDLGIRLTPLDYLGMSYGATVSFERSQLLGQTVGFFVREPWWTPPSAVQSFQAPSTVGLSYRFIENGVNRGLAPNSPETILATNGIREFDASVYLRLGNYMGFTFLSRYDLNTTAVGTKTLGPHFLERDYLLHLVSRCNCWVLDAGVADKTNPDERLFRIQFTLVGLGSLGSGRGTPRNYVGFAPLTDLGYQRPLGGAVY